MGIFEVKFIKNDSSDLFFILMSKISHQEQLYQTMGTIELPKTSRQKISKSFNRNHKSFQSNVNIHSQKLQQMSIDRQLLNTELPKITTSRKPYKRGSFLQVWLNDALEFNDMGSQKVETGLLTTLKRYELDREYLRSQNISAEKIEKLYNGLYMYSHGINQMFSEMIEIATGSSSATQRLINSFWRAFTKLLEGCSAFKTASQVVDHSRQQLIKQMKTKYQELNDQVAKLQESMVIQARKHSKMMQEQHARYRQLESLHQITQSTLQLTDQAFNQQVELRLKFQQKINMVNTSHQELKSKYEQLLSDLKLKSEFTMEKLANQSLLEEKIKQLQITRQELVYLLDRQRQHVRERDEEIEIKKQEMTDLIEKLEVSNQTIKEGEDHMQEKFDSIRSLTSKNKEYLNQNSSLKIVIVSREKHIKEQQERMANTRQVNDQIFQKSLDHNLEIADLNTQYKLKEIQITTLEKQIQTAATQNSDRDREIDHIRAENMDLRKQIEALNCELKDKNTVIEKNAICIGQLRTVNEKHIQISAMLETVRDQLVEEIILVKKERDIAQEEKVSLEEFLQAKTNRVEELEEKLDREVKVLKRRVTGLTEESHKKEIIILKNQTKFGAQEEQLRQKQLFIEDLKEKLVQKESQLKKKEVEMNYTIKKGENQSEETNDKAQKLFGLNKKYEQTLKKNDELMQELRQAQYLIQQKNVEGKTEVSTMKQLINEYEGTVFGKAGYIHPMLYEDSIMQLQCKLEALEALRIKYQHSQKQITQFSQTLKKQQLRQKNLQQEKECLQQQKERLQLQKQSCEKALRQEQQISQLLKVKIEQNTKDKSDLEHKYQKMLALEAEQQKTMKEQFHQQKSKLQRDIQQKDTTIEELKTLKAKQAHKLSELKEEKHKYQLQISELKEIEALYHQLSQKKPSTPALMRPQLTPPSQASQRKLIKTVDAQIQTEKQKLQSRRSRFSFLETPQERGMQTDLLGDTDSMESSAQFLQMKEEPKKVDKKVEKKDFSRALRLTYMRR